MRALRFATVSTLLGCLVVLGSSRPAPADPSGPAAAASGEVARQDVPTPAGAEADTVAEPDVAVNPRRGDNAIAVVQDARYPDAAAAAISAAWTADGGATWHHRAVPGLTTMTVTPACPESGPCGRCSKNGRRSARAPCQVGRGAC